MDIRLILTRTGMMLAVALTAAVLLGCAAQVPSPVRSPLAEPHGTFATLPPLVTAVPTVRGESPPPAAEVEPAAGRATALLAEWLAVPQRELVVIAAEAVAWPSACLGVEHPGVACASVITPGFKVLLQDRQGGIHTVHLDAGSGGARWAGETRSQAVVTSVDRAAQRVTVETGSRVLILRLVPGTQWFPTGGQAAAPGSRVMVAYDPSGSASAIPIAAWIIPVS